MATKKQEKLSGEEILQETTPQTDGNPELEELSQPEDDSPDPELSQTDTEDSLERVSSEEFRDADSEGEILPQTDMESRLRSRKRKYLPRPMQILPEMISLQKTR